MRLERLTCSACKGNLEWDAARKIFICGNCGCVYRRVDELEIDKSEKDLEKAKMNYEIQRKQKELELERIKQESKQKEESRNTVYIVLGCIMVAFMYIMLSIIVK